MAFTYFFRDIQTLETFRDHVMPSLKSRRYIRIWDAGCAMGAEPFSLAIVLRESMGPMIFRNVHILATDIDTMDQFGDMIHSGVYPERDVKRIPRDIFSGYFMPNCQPDHFQLVDEIRNRVTFQKHDLLTLQSPRDDFGAILCKNVLLHLKQKERVDVIKMFYGALADNGYLVTEQTQKLPSEVEHLFERVVTHAQVFRKV